MFGVLTLCLPIEFFHVIQPAPKPAPLVSYTFKFKHTGNAVMRPDNDQTESAN